MNDALYTGAYMWYFLLCLELDSMLFLKAPQKERGPLEKDLPEDKLSEWPCRLLVLFWEDFVNVRNGASTSLWGRTSCSGVLIEHGMRRLGSSLEPVDLLDGRRAGLPLPARAFLAASLTGFSLQQSHGPKATFLTARTQVMGWDTVGSGLPHRHLDEPEELHTPCRKGTHGSSTGCCTEDQQGAKNQPKGLWKCPLKLGGGNLLGTNPCITL